MELSFEYIFQGSFAHWNGPRPRGFFCATELAPRIRVFSAEQTLRMEFEAEVTEVVSERPHDATEDGDWPAYVRLSNGKVRQYSKTQ